MKIIKLRHIILVVFFLVLPIIYGNTGISFLENCNDEIQCDIFGTNLLFAQQEDSADKDAAGDGNSKSAEDSESQDSVLFMVMIIVLIIWIGIGIYLFLLNRKVSSLEKKIDE